MSSEPLPTTASADRPLFLAIAGNIGVGKSTLTRHLADTWGLTLLPEPVKENPFLKLYYDDPKRWGIQSQLFFLTQRVKLFKEAGALNHAKIVDRTLYEDAEIFARTALSRVEYEIYLQLYEYLLENLPVPNLVVYLRASTRTLSRRIQSRGRSFEKALPSSYLRKLNERYDAWASSFLRAPLIAIDTDDLDLFSLFGEYERVTDRIAEALIQKGLTWQHTTTIPRHS
ncbi:MAG: deoxynucleoside kinase [Caldisericia bacterium]|jgi:deoxyadenosine/deoxycytidine kinase|nr:deoxynucleoside kinase [Coprothermobacter sp.]